MILISNRAFAAFLLAGAAAVAPGVNGAIFASEPLTLQDATDGNEALQRDLFDAQKELNLLLQNTIEEQQAEIQEIKSGLLDEGERKSSRRRKLHGKGSKGGPSCGKGGSGKNCNPNAPVSSKGGKGGKGGSSALGCESACLSTESISCATLPPDVFVGVGACLENEACLNVVAGTCIGEKSCLFTNACETTAGTVEKDSCVGNFACKSAIVNLGQDSCVGRRACENNIGVTGTTLTTKAGSCRGFAACRDTDNLTVGKSSCLGTRPCQTLSGIIIGDNSCQGLKACAKVEVDIGDNSCNCDGCCECASPLGADVDVGNDKCNVDGECCPP
jgi:hypothetical protein